MTVRPGIYHHYKGPLYVVLGVAEESTNGRPEEASVVYFSVEKEKLRSRVEAEFVELLVMPDVEHGGTESVPRFAFVCALPGLFGSERGPVAQLAGICVDVARLMGDLP
jgi:hypothetical protein